MKLEVLPLKLEDRTATIKSCMASGARLGLVTSIDGGQLLTILLAPESKQIRCYQTEVEGGQYHSMTPVIPQAHWFERTTLDMFGLLPLGHPRLKHTHLHEPYVSTLPPLAKHATQVVGRPYEFLNVEGEGVYEIPVGPIHAGIIEPGHFRFSCYGEVVANLEIQLGYVHRGVEKRLTEVPPGKARFVAEAAASDMAVANACAHSVAVEALFEFEIPRSAWLLRTVAAEIERVAMHLSDLGGIAGDIGFLAVSSSMARLRGLALRLAELVGGNRFLRGYVCPGGVSRPWLKASLSEMRQVLHALASQLQPVLDIFLSNQVAVDRMEGVGKVSPKLAAEFGLVGVSARASGVGYDCRASWSSATFPSREFAVVTEQSGDVYARAKVRIGELAVSLLMLSALFDELASTSGPSWVPLPQILPPDATAIGIIESHRGELIHLIVTDEEGAIKRYCIKDPGVNNWTGLAIAVRNNLVADFPLCNKSFGLSYSGHDL
ncbi:MAG: NADH-quinone oxidoreductase subunit C [Candidatus Obscuribacterales bacterium]|nr:NADH-quinone oxidoreductase subunit C [Candidatus Obscuribacterales bacterium]